MKDPQGHGSDARGGSTGRAVSAHQQARKAIQQSPDAPPAWAHDALVRVGYSENDIAQLRLNAGGAGFAAHQTGVQVATASKDLTRRMIVPDLERLKKIAGAR